MMRWMTRWLSRASVLLSLSVLACSAPPPPPPPPVGDALTLPQETHLRNMRQLTFEGDNAEAYFSFDGSKLTFMSTAGHDNLPSRGCDQIYTMNIDCSGRQLVSTGKGRTTCSYFYPDGQHILYASTHLGGDACPPAPDKSNGYVWAIYDSYDIFRAKHHGAVVKWTSKLMFWIQNLLMSLMSLV